MKSGILLRSSSCPGSSRASTSLLTEAKKTWMPGTRPGMTKNQRPAAALRSAEDGLESVKKTEQVAGVGRPIQVGCCRPGGDICRTRVTLRSVDMAPAHFNSNSTSTRHRLARLCLARLGYVIDDGPRDEAPGDADCGGARP